VRPKTSAMKTKMRVGSTRINNYYYASYLPFNVDIIYLFDIILHTCVFFNHIYKNSNNAPHPLTTPVRGEQQS
jgi:hypothetical protein